MKKILCTIHSLRHFIGILIVVLYCMIFGLSMLFIDQLDDVQSITFMLTCVYLIIWLIAAIGYGLNNSKGYLAISFVYWLLVLITFFAPVDISVVREVLYLLFGFPVFAIVAWDAYKWISLLFLIIFVSLHFLLYFIFRRMAVSAK